MSAFATPAATRAYAAARDLPGAAWREWRGLTLSSLGFGSYLGDDTDEADARYAEAFALGLVGGVNVLDTAANYRGGRSERAVGAALRAARDAGVPREAYLLATKGGFVASPARLARYAQRGIVAPAEVAMGCHVMTPAYLAHELSQSLESLGVDAIDVYFLHNPETQLEAVGKEVFEARLRACFAFLEEERRAQRIGVYGLATWHGLRVGSLQLERILEIARAVGGDGHGLRAIELPYNLAMPEAARALSQRWRDRELTVLEAAQEADLLVLGSATLMQTRLLRGVPGPVRERLGGDALEAAIQFSRSTPGITCALVGTGDPAHARRNVEVLRSPLRVTETKALLGG